VIGHSAIGDGPALLLHAAGSLSAPRALPIGTPFTPPSTQDTLGEPMSTVAGTPASGLSISTGAASTTAHGFEWHNQPVLQPIGGAVLRTPWFVRAPRRDVISEGRDAVGFGRTRTPLDYFLAVFPQEQLKLTSELKSAALVSQRLRPTSAGEVLKFFGILILATRFQFGSRADLLATAPRSKHIPAPAFGERTGISRHRFDTMWSAPRSSRQQTGGPSTDDASGERYRWALLNDLISSINNHRAALVSPGDTICVDESMVKWYGLGEAWIAIGPPMYIYIDRKPENGCEIQNAACGRSGIMLRLHLVTTAADQPAHLSADESHLLHGTADFALFSWPLGRNGAHCLCGLLL